MATALSSAPRHQRYVEMTPEREQKVTQLLQLMQQHFNPLPEQLQLLLRYSPTPADAPTPHNTMGNYCYCALISCQWDVQKSFEGMKINVAYRQQCHLDERSELPSAVSIRGWDQMAVSQALGKTPRQPNQREDQIVAAMEHYFPCGLHYWDKYGQPVFYLMLGSVDEEPLLKKLKQTANVGQTMDAVVWHMLQHLLGSGEWLAYYQQMQYDAGQLKVDASEGLIRATTIVVDLKGLTYKMIWKPAIDLLLKCLKELFNHYPECVHQIVVVNAPAMVSFGYRIVRSVLPATVQAKIRLASPADSLALLREHIDDAHIPHFYGGACQCQGGCIRAYNLGTGLAANGATTVGQDGSLSATEEVPMDGGVSTEDISLRAGAAHKKVFVLRQDESVVWDFVSSTGHDIAFATYFVPEAQAQGVDMDRVDVRSLEPYVVSKGNPSEGSSDYTATTAGVLVLVWDNKQSWVTTKHLQMKVFKQQA